MCLIMTICAAVVFTVIYFMNKKNGKVRKSISNTCLMFWAAAIMWSVDGISSVMGGEPFFDISREDTILGFIIVGAGLVVYAMMAMLEKKRTVSRL